MMAIYLFLAKVKCWIGIALARGLVRCDGSDRNFSKLRW